MTTINIHGLKFGIDTADWYHEEDAAKVSDLIAEMMEGWTKEYAQHMHYLSLEVQKDVLEGDYDILGEGQAACDAIAKSILDTYATWPNVGHNAGFWAIA